MSKQKPVKPLTHSEISKKIISNEKSVRLTQELYDFSGKYRDENVADYNGKMEGFMKAAKQYKKYNAETMIKEKVVLHDNYEQRLDLSFLKEDHHVIKDCESLCCCSTSTPNLTGQVYKKRTIRPANFTPNPVPDICLNEPWFRRYLTLNKFITAARTVIIQNRLLKVLEKLKVLTPADILKIQQSPVHRKCEDYHCHPVFEKFL
ncbi:uncharacterized protein LOC115881745 [Sitophilus oryzae]|uniref:Uncharacterized protein LOC115881745 n=1 Tax=Sitophilus oryzae TaxID=7048 RepID=A0A6J2XUN7_SITOR|nr:uncharacterized protein LOC115881745 [Sitophilus oryzae]